MNRFDLSIARTAQRALVALALCLGFVASARAQLVLPTDEVMIGYAPKVLHFNPSPEHVDWNNFLAFELHTERSRLFEARKALFGLAFFNNSFGQPSQYLYWGQLYDLARVGPGKLYAKVTLGLLHGYRGEYQDKIPFNQAGVAPAIIPALGYGAGNFSGEVALLGASGLLFAVTYKFSPF